MWERGSAWHSSRPDLAPVTRSGRTSFNSARLPLLRLQERSSGRLLFQTEGFAPDKCPFYDRYLPTVGGNLHSYIFIHQLQVNNIWSPALNTVIGLTEERCCEVVRFVWVLNQTNENKILILENSLNTVHVMEAIVGVLVVTQKHFLNLRFR